ncbi:MinD/ParA family protein [Desulfovibrio litoralis]|uniref:Flagellar biosynthesis protein FlhG n=1 Tax=Desulfovibrio litoralis DSM 11393 TaxID=1121455 RepID=A0A1M7TD06_9BACT|nr:MinD/ParA family protein [Desulfovibrio litoralis]SHN68541.1 flagellar biosynthesis protein FlhG [Desulfovibrio litoralis DSM 11393]
MATDLPLVFSITSGKGGVGKTNISVNLAYSLAQAGKRVLLLDADLGLANVDVILGLMPELNLFHLFHEDAKVTDIICDTPYGFKVLPASSGVSEMLALTTAQKLDLLEAMDGLEDSVDYMIVDTGAGINDNVVYFNLAAQERIVVLTPEPTSLTDAYALIKVMKLDHGIEHFKVVVNMVPDLASAKEVFTRLHRACDHFLSGVSLDLIGFLPKDPGVRKAVREQKPFCLVEPKGLACSAMKGLARTVQGWDIASNLDGNIKFFWKKLLFRS